MPCLGILIVMKHQSVLSFQKHLESAQSSQARVYLIAVPDDFERKKWLSRVAALFGSPGQSLLCLSAASSTLSELFTATESPSLFDPEPTMLVDEIEKLSKKDAQKLLEWLARSELSGHLIFGSRGKSPLSSAVEKKGIVFDLCEEKPWEKEKRFSLQLSERAKQAGKYFSPQAQQALLERVDKESALLEQELDKLICFVGEKSSIEPSDVFQIAASSRTQTLWQMAEEMVWEAKYVDRIDETMFHGLAAALRSQLQLGLKIATLAAANLSISEIGARVPKVWPKMLEKRISQASQFQAEYFKKGLRLLFQIEMLSRSNAGDLLALLDFFRLSLRKSY